MDSTVVIDLQFGFSEVIFEDKGVAALADVLAGGRVHSCLDFAADVHDDDLWVVTGTNRLKEGVVCHLERDRVEIGQLEMEQRHVLENDRVVLEDVVLIVSALNRFTFDGLDVVFELFPLIVLKLGEIAFNEAEILSGKRSDLDLHFGVKQELDCALVIRLDLSDPVLLGNGSRNRLPDRLLGLLQGVNL